MRKILLFFFALASLFSYADPDVIILNPDNPEHDRSGFSITLCPPAAYYDNDSHIIIINGSGVVDFYDVEITALSTFDVPISTRIDGTYDTIDISSLPSDDYVITINTPMEISYQSKFTII